MKLIATKQGKSDRYDLLRCVRRDGSHTATTMPRQGVLPHDLIHYAVESALGYRHGFLGMVAGGAGIAFAMEQSHAAHAEGLADQAGHAESIVESLQAQLWNGAFDQAGFEDGVRTACAARALAPPVFEALDTGKRLFGDVVALQQRWQQLPFHASLELDMPQV